MSSARSVAKELVRVSTSGPLPDPPTLYRLQCLLYFAQAWSLVLRDSELFPDEIEASAEGPSVPDVLVRGDESVLCAIGPKVFEDEPDLDENDEALFLRHLWLDYAHLSPTGMYDAIQREPSFLAAKGEAHAREAGRIGVSRLRESFERRGTVPAALSAYRQARQQREREAELAILNGQPLDVDAIWGRRIATPAASREG